MLSNIDPTKTSAWSKLTAKYEANKNVSLKELFSKDKNRFNTFSRTFGNDVLLDFSKNLISEDIFEDLIALAEEVNLDAAIKAMFNGEKNK